MSITGSITDFSLPEIFQFIEKGNKSGLLTVRALTESQVTRSSTHYIWVAQGNIVAAASQLDNQGLVLLIDQYPWVSHRVVTKLAQFCPADQPLGFYLKNQGALQAEQLEHLFQIQVVQQLCAVFQLKEAQFKFDQNVPLPMQEMTGLTLQAGILKVMLQKLAWLQKLFEVRKQQRETSGLNSHSNNFCNQLSLILDIAFFHSLNFSLLNTNNEFAKLSQVFDLAERPYDLPKSRKTQALCSTRR
jgi:hypothetical protein